MFLIIGALLFAGLIFLRKYCRVGFLSAQIFAGFAWVIVHYNNYFYELVMSFIEIWILASLAALAIKPKEREKD